MILIIYINLSLSIPSSYGKFFFCIRCTDIRIWSNDWQAKTNSIS
jgi:hypothetical protein